MKYKFICPLFEVKVLLITGDKKQLEKYTEDFGENEHDAECHTVFNKDDDIDSFLVWIKSSIDYNGMVHEIMHLVRKIFDCMGVPFNSDNDEIMAYYQGYWIRTFWHKIKIKENLREVKI